MAKDYTPNKLDLTTFHGGKQYENGQALNVEDFNKLVEGVAYAQENGGKKLYMHTVVQSDTKKPTIRFVNSKPNILSGYTSLGEAINETLYQTAPLLVQYSATPSTEGAWHWERVDFTAIGPDTVICFRYSYTEQKIVEYTIDFSTAVDVTSSNY